MKNKFVAHKTNDVPCCCRERYNIFNIKHIFLSSIVPPDPDASLINILQFSAHLSRGYSLDIAYFIKGPGCPIELLLDMH